MIQVDPGEIERRWIAWRVHRNRRGTRTILWMVVTLYPLFGVLDYLVAPREWWALLWSTRVAVTALTLAMFRIIESPVFERASTALSSIYVVVIASGISLMTVVMGGLSSPYYAGIGLIMVATGLLFLWPPAVVIATHASMVATFLVANLVRNRHPDVLSAVQNFFFLASTAIIASGGQIFGYRSQREQVANQVALERTKVDLEQANDKLKQIDRFKSQFFANITHELKTPLALILSPLELMLDGELGEVSEAQRATLRSMFKSGAKLLKLIGDLLDLSRMEESHVRIRIAEHDVVGWLRGLTAQVEPLTQRKRIRLELEAAVAEAHVFCDLERMERVFVNLLSNAAKFTAEGGRIVVRVTDESERVRITVEDDGAGFPPDQADRIFERFYQIDMGGTRKYGGTGIGLALAREIVELHGGTITAEGEVGKGARFHVILRKGRDHFRPEVLDRRAGRRDVAGGKREGDRSAVEWAMQMSSREDFRFLEIADATERRLLERDPDENRRGHTVLVVEDTPDVIRVIHLALRQHYKIMAAVDGKKGLELAFREIPDLIITDLMMPEMDGLELTRQLRADPRTKHVPIVMLTARSDVDDRLAGVEVGVNAYMAKPFFAKELLGTVRALLEKQQSTAEMLLEQRMGSLETVASGLAHEINNPLNWVKNALTRIRMDVTSLRAELVREPRDTTKLETLEERIAKMFGTAESGVARIGQTVELMGRYSREGFTRAMRNHDLFASARDVVDLLVPGSGRDIRVNAHFDGDGVAECVPEEMIQVITNVVQNAIDAVADGTGRVEVRGRAEDGVVVLEVSDNGPGIPADTRARLFTPFFTTKGPGRGMGLGLTITWRVVHALGGTVQVDSEPGLGTKFTLRIPRTRQAPAVGAA